MSVTYSSSMKVKDPSEQKRRVLRTHIKHSLIRLAEIPGL